MARANRYDDLDEMLVPEGLDSKEDDRTKASSRKKAKKAGDEKANLPPYQRQKLEQQRRESRKIVLTVVAVFAALLIVLVAIGMVMTDRAENNAAVTKATPAAGKSGFLNEQNYPDFSAEGIKGELKEVYYTTSGDLAVTLNLSNGTSHEHQVMSVEARIFNAANETVAEQKVESFRPKCLVPANSYGEVYFLIDKENVALSDDPLSELGVTLQIGSKRTDGGSNTADNSHAAGVGDGPKDIAQDRTYYENLGNIPALSEEGIKATIIRARYTNDGSLAITLSLSNGTEYKQQVSSLDFLLQNGETGATIADYTFDTFESPCTVEAKNYAEVDLIVDSAYVAVQDDALSSLSCTVSVSAGPTE